jgi:hypothetical protein
MVFVSGNLLVRRACVARRARLRGVALRCAR